MKLHSNAINHRAARGWPLAIVIDLDGTLADTFSAMKSAYAEAAGRPVETEELLTLFGPGAGTEAQILELLGAAEPGALEQWYRTYHAAHESLAPFPGMKEALTNAKQRGIRTGMLTGKGRRSTEITLERLGVRDLLEVVVTGDEAPAPKPDPRGLLLVLERLGIAPAQSVYLGDSAADLAAARAAGVPMAAVLWDPRASIALSGESPDFILRTAADLRLLLPE